MSELKHVVATAGRFQSWAATHCGTVRTHNEDGYLNRPDLSLWAVADGAGGHDSGEVASAHVVAALSGIPPNLSAGPALAEVRRRVNDAHAALQDAAAKRGAGMIATTVVVLLARNDHFACLWAGDSRAYLLRGGTFSQLSRDHSLVQTLIDSGAISAEEADGHSHANVITRAVGAETETFELEKRSGPLHTGDRLLLCSDGLCKALSDPAMAVILGSDEDSPAERLVLAALAAQATDNVTAVTVEVLAPGGATPG